jgi:hypothetical protein
MLLGHVSLLSKFYIIIDMVIIKIIFFIENYNDREFDLFLNL